MYRVILVPTDEFAPKELWLNAHAVLETDCGEFWDFVDGDGRLVRRLEKTRVRSFVITPDRRKPRPVQDSILEDILAGVGASISYRI
ncbi:MAG TPA: hypothetical protein VM848_12420 [Acidimicrobiia bacterium]|nr:hypothetical protein [Acidimicrobiia bacterium]